MRKLTLTYYTIKDEPQEVTIQPFPYSKLFEFAELYQKFMNEILSYDYGIGSFLGGGKKNYNLLVSILKLIPADTETGNLNIDDIAYDYDFLTQLLIIRDLDEDGNKLSPEDFDRPHIASLNRLDYAGITKKARLSVIETEQATNQ